MIDAGRATTPGGSLLVLAILLPVGGNPRVLRARRPLRRTRRARLRAVGARDRARDRSPRSGARARPIVYVVAGLAPPLGIALAGRRHIGGHAGDGRADHPRRRALRARRLRDARRARRESRKALTFWIMLQAIWAALAIIFVSGDLFNLYVALELLTFAAVPLACVEGRAGDASPPRCAICCSRCSARSSTCSAPRSSMAPTGRSTSCCWPSAFARLPAVWRRRR